MNVATCLVTGLLKALLDRVVARFAQALEVLRVEEQRLITAMRLNVVAYGGGNLTTGAGAEDAKRLTPQLLKAETFPCCTVVKSNSAFHDVMIQTVMAIGLSGRQYWTTADKK